MADEPAKDEQQHYFSAQPQRASRPRQIAVTIRGLKLNLLTDRGVFSYGELDRGSKLLAATMALPEQGEVLDWGAGYGVLGLVAALLCPRCHVTLVEVNERAAALARTNVAAAGADNTTVLCGEAPGALGSGRFDVVISNPPLHAGKVAVAAVIEDAAARLRPGGELWLVVPTRKGAKGFLNLMAERFAQARVLTISGGFRVLWARKAGPPQAAGGCVRPDPCTASALDT